MIGGLVIVLYIIILVYQLVDGGIRLAGVEALTQEYFIITRMGYILTTSIVHFPSWN